MRPLKFSATIAEAYRFIWANKRDFFAFAYLPVIALSIFSTVLDAAFPVTIPPDLSQFSPELLFALYARLLLVLVFSLVMYVVFAVPWHRLQLIGSEGGTVGAALRWQPRHSRYLTRLFLLALAWFVFLTLVVTLVATSVNPAGGGITVSPLMLLIGVILLFIVLGQLLRGGVLLTAVAVDDSNVGLAEAWRLSRRCSSTLLALFLAATLPATFASALLIGQFAALIGAETVAGSLPLRFVFTLLGQILSFVAFAALTSAMSIAYRELKAAAAGSV